MTARSTSSPVHLVTTSPHSHRGQRSGPSLREQIAYHRRRADEAEDARRGLERALAAVFGAQDGDVADMPAEFAVAWCSPQPRRYQAVRLPDGSVIVLDASRPADPVRAWRQLAALTAPRAVS